VSDNGFEPKLVGFFCRWCSYQGADLAGTSRIEYPPNVVPIRVMCTGRIDPTFVLKAFAEGADGVVILGCHPGDCHYDEGNYNALRRYHILSTMLEQLGIDRKRFRLDWASASEGERFAQIITEVTEDVRELGPLNWGGEKEVKSA
jgi:F420-non-reducing hydrogenase iron-sulfur subunit